MWKWRHCMRELYVWQDHTVYNSWTEGGGADTGQLHNPVGPHDEYYVSNLCGGGLKYNKQFFCQI